jgi:para-aminobenzoate synthetase/4-amino-4-deoxychorismate lyase
VPSAPLTYVVATKPVDPADPFLYHKTTVRGVYDEAFAEAQRQGASEALLVNHRGELTEGSRSNIVLRRGERLLTPRVSSGLLAGVYRASLIARGGVEEATLTLRDLEECDEVLLCNALWGLRRAEALESVVNLR